MKDNRSVIRDLISQISSDSWKAEMDQTASRYHVAVLWVAIIFDPIFGIVDYINIPNSWGLLFVVRLSVSATTLILLVARRKYSLPSYPLVLITFLMISLQNAYTYQLITRDNLLAQNVNYMALLIGASMFILWPLTYSIVVVIVSAVATTIFISLNPALPARTFFLTGGMLLTASAVFMIVLIQTRYTLMAREIRTRLALKASNEEIQAQAEEIKGINDNLELLVKARTEELEKKNSALEEYAFINAHKLRGPVASILGLIHLMNKIDMDDDARNVLRHLQDSTEKLDAIVNSITRAIEKGEKIS
jgi:signal transduction histidine kinase